MIERIIGIYRARITFSADCGCGLPQKKLMPQIEILVGPAAVLDENRRYIRVVLSFAAEKIRLGTALIA